MCTPPRRCAAGSWCHGDHDGHGAAPEPGLPYCPSCLAVAGRELRALVLDYADLEQVLVKITGRGLAISGTREPPVPLALGVDALQRAIWSSVTAWEEIVREVAGLPDRPQHTRHGWAVQRAVAILEPRIALLATLEPVAVYDVDTGRPVELAGAEAIALFAKLHKRARAVLGLTRKIEILYGECPECGWEALRRDSGSETVYCGQCGDRRTWDDYRRWLGLQYEHARATMRRSR